MCLREAEMFSERNKLQLTLAIKYVSPWDWVVCEPDIAQVAPCESGARMESQGQLLISQAIQCCRSSQQTLDGMKAFSALVLSLNEAEIFVLSVASSKEIGSNFSHEWFHFY